MQTVSFWTNAPLTKARPAQASSDQPCLKKCCSTYLMKRVLARKACLRLQFKRLIWVASLRHLRIVAVPFTVIECNLAAFKLVLDCGGRTVETSGDLTQGLALLAQDLDNYADLHSKMLALLVSRYGRIKRVHWKLLSRIDWVNYILSEKSNGLFSFSNQGKCSTLFYNLPPKNICENLKIDMDI